MLILLDKVRSSTKAVTKTKYRSQFTNERRQFKVKNLLIIFVMKLLTVFHQFFIVLNIVFQITFVLY